RANWEIDSRNDARGYKTRAPCYWRDSPRTPPHESFLSPQRLPYTHMTARALARSNPCLLMRFNENTLQKPTGRNNRHGQEDCSRRALLVPRLRGVLGADGGGYAGEQARGVARAADRLR